MHCENKEKCDLSLAIQEVIDETGVDEKVVREAIKNWLNEKYINNSDKVKKPN